MVRNGKKEGYAFYKFHLNLKKNAYKMKLFFTMPVIFAGNPNNKKQLLHTTNKHYLNII